MIIMEKGKHFQPAFTGRKGGTYYYKGIRWLGPSNMIGHGTLAWVELSPHVWGITSIRR